MITKKFFLYFPKSETEKPIVCHLVKDYNLIINIFRAKVTPQEEGYLILDITGEEDDIKKGLEYVKTFNVTINETTKGLRWDKEKCTHCGNCIPHCPTNALYIPDRKTMEVSVSKREHTWFNFGNIKTDYYFGTDSEIEIKEGMKLEDIRNTILVDLETGHVWANGVDVYKRSLKGEGVCKSCNHSDKHLQCQHKHDGFCSARLQTNSETHCRAPTGSGRITLNRERGVRLQDRTTQQHIAFGNRRGPSQRAQMAQELAGKECGRP